MVRCWGVRGSLPTPLAPETVREKIAAVISRASSEDMRSMEAKERFLASLPRWLFGTWGGNTACVEVRSGADILLFDAGSGIRDFATEIMRRPRKQREYHLFFSHFHWDHIIGLPFFTPLYDPGVRVCLYSPVRRFREYLEVLMSPPFFPVTMEAMRADKEFIVLEEDVPYRVGRGFVTPIPMTHPGGSYAYRIERGGKAVLYATDVELADEDFLPTPENRRRFSGVDLLIIDSQYTLGEAIEKINWGHSSFTLVVDFAVRWKIPRVLLFHHEPLYDDKFLFHNCEAAREYAAHQGGDLDIRLAQEGEIHYVSVE